MTIIINSYVCVLFADSRSEIEVVQGDVSELETRLDKVKITHTHTSIHALEHRCCSSEPAGEVRVGGWSFSLTWSPNRTNFSFLFLFLLLENGLSEILLNGV